MQRHTGMHQNKNVNAISITSVQKIQPHCSIFVAALTKTSARHNLHKNNASATAFGIDAFSLALRFATVTVMKLLLLGFKEYRDPDAAKDRKLEHREHVAFELGVLFLKRLSGLIGSRQLNWESATTVSHFLRPEYCTIESTFSCFKLDELPSRFNSGTTFQSFCCTTFNEELLVPIRSIADLSLLLNKLLSEGLGIIFISGEGSRGAGFGSFDDFRPTRDFKKFSNRFLFGTDPESDDIEWLLFVLFWCW